MIDGRRKKRPGADVANEPAEQGTAGCSAGEQGGAVRPPEPDGRTGIRLNLGKRLVTLGVRADHVTVLGVLIAALTGAMLALGHLWIGVALVTVGGLMDTLDGAVAKAAGSASKRGAFFDSVTDRVADAFIFGGLAWYFAGGPGKDAKLALLPFGILAVSNVISYERAKAESLGYVAKGGLMERAERLILLGLALALNIVLVPLLWVLLALCVFTAGQRFTKVWRQASADTGTGLPAHARAWRPARVESRWRAWREASSANRRPRVAPRSRVRARRHEEPLSTRVRRMLVPETAGARGEARSRRPERARRTRTRRSCLDAPPPSRHRPLTHAPAWVATSSDARRPVLSKSRTTYLSYRSLAGALQLFPRPIADGIAVASGRVMWQVWKDKRPVVRANLRRVFGPGVTEDELDEAVVKAFDSYARYWVESARLATIRPSEVLRRMTTIGFESATSEIDNGRGAILALTHAGSWEIGGYWLTLQGTPLVTVAEPVEPPELFAWFREQREMMGLTVLPFGPETSRQLLSALRSGRLVGLLCDRDILGNGVEVEFFGEKTTLPAGPALLSLRTGAPIIPTSVYQEPGGMHRGVLRPPLRFERTGDLRSDVTALTQLLAHELEDLIRWAPTQWHAFQPIWPPGFTGAGDAEPTRA